MRRDAAAQRAMQAAEYVVNERFVQLLTARIDGEVAEPLPVVIFTDKVGVAPFRKTQMRACTLEVLVSRRGPEDLIFLPEAVDVQELWREVLIPELLQLQKGT